MDNPTRRDWSRVFMPHELVDVISLIARARGYDPADELHLFIYDMLKSLYPQDMERLDHYLNGEWKAPTELPPPTPPDD